MSIVGLAEATDEAEFGGKAVQLGTALRAGLSVPPGFAISARLVGAVVEGHAAALAVLERSCGSLDGPCAVRSSAVGEDSAQASFAGQHATRLNVSGFAAAIEAIRDVWASGRTTSALDYRRRVGVEGEPRVAVVIQRLVPAEMAGVLFTRDPLSGRDEIVVEAGWGLGESVVQGMVVPDRYRMTRSGEVLERTAGSKGIRIDLAPHGGTRHCEVPVHLARRLCLGYRELRDLHGLARHCDAVFGEEPHDIEWAFGSDGLYLLQRRPVTRAA